MLVKLGEQTPTRWLSFWLICVLGALSFNCVITQKSLSHLQLVTSEASPRRGHVAPYWPASTGCPLISLIAVKWMWATVREPAGGLSSSWNLEKELRFAQLIRTSGEFRGPELRPWRGPSVVPGGAKSGCGWA